MKKILIILLIVVGFAQNSNIDSTFYFSEDGDTLYIYREFADGNSENIINGIKTVQPSAIDVNSGVESEPGVKDRVKVEKLFNSISHLRFKFRPPP